MTTTEHTITVLVTWADDDGEDDQWATTLTKGGGSFSIHVLNLAKLGIVRPEPFGPRFKTGDIIFRDEQMQIYVVTSISPEGACLMRPGASFPVYVGWESWDALAKFVKIGERT